LSASACSLSVLLPQHVLSLQRGTSFWTGLAFVLLVAAVAAYSTVQYRKVLKTLKPIEIPEGYRVSPGIITNLAVALLGIALTIYFFQGV
jgi:putative membrane protein